MCYQNDFKYPWCMPKKHLITTVKFRQNTQPNFVRALVIDAL
jgi:hypothetical protein